MLTGSFSATDNDHLALRVPFLAPLLHLGYLPLLGVDDVPGDLLDLRVLALAEGDVGHLDGRPVVGDHRVYERLVEGTLPPLPCLEPPEPLDPAQEASASIATTSNSAKPSLRYFFKETPLLKSQNFLVRSLGEVTDETPVEAER